MLHFNRANEQVPGLIDRLGWNLQQTGVLPELLSFDEVDAVFYKVGLPLEFVKLKHGIESIPFLNPRNVAMGPIEIELRIGPLLFEWNGPLADLIPMCHRTDGKKQQHC